MLNLRPKFLRGINWKTALLLALPALYLLGLVPDTGLDVLTKGGNASFAWDRDAYWNQLETMFEAARSKGCDTVSLANDSQMTRWEELLESLEAETLGAGDSRLIGLEKLVFETAPGIAACPSGLPRLARLVNRTRQVVKKQSTRWEIDKADVKERLYRLVYGSRMALEEVMLQQTPGKFKREGAIANPPSQTPYIEAFGVRIHSGDLLVSRGGAPTSALIARGNDYPGNFSHVALVHVDENTSEASIIEAHIERGVAVATVDEYVADTKLRIMVLRPRAQLPAIAHDPMLPHKAATMALSRARREHIPYDFAMDFNDPSLLFCSEVASFAYRAFGIELWMNLSSISNPTVESWLRGFGVQHFRTQAPSDLEYDPQLQVVAEWVDAAILRKDHLDNAVIDAMIDTAPKGSKLPHNHLMLPFVRVAGLYSVIVNQFGGIGPVPEGMSSTAALTNQKFSATHEQTVARLEELAASFKKEHGYNPPYWELVSLAEQSLEY